MCDESVPASILQKGKELRGNLLPKKSKDAYEKVYDTFRRWVIKEGIKMVTEDVILAYLDARSLKLCPSSLWPEYSMLKATLKAKENLDIGKFSAIIPYLKNLNVGYCHKKSKVLTRDEIETFLKTAENEEYLFMKVALLFGIAGACRRVELCNLQFSDITDCGDVLNVTIRDTKTHKDRRFSIINSGFGVNPIDLYRRYVALRPINAPSRFFLQYCKGKCSRQVVGINTFGAIPKRIAAFLNLENPDGYTGHTFRRSSATIFVDSGGDITHLKKHGGWESTKVAESYIDESFEQRVKIAKTVFGDQGNLVNQNSGSSPQPSTSASGSVDGAHKSIHYNNCTFNFHK